jgi:hypothetical protein
MANGTAEPTLVQAYSLEVQSEVPPLTAQTRLLELEPSERDIAELAKRFVEPLRGEVLSAPRRRNLPRPTLVPRSLTFPETQAPANAEPSPSAKAQGKPGLPRNAVVSVVVVLALVPLAMLFVRLWQDTLAPRAGDGATPAAGVSASIAPAKTALAQPVQHEKTLEVALSSPDRIEANAGEVIDFPIAIDATDALPARSIVAITALPEGASFSQGRPYGVTGWTFRPDEIGDLQLNLPAPSGSADMRLELVAGDGTVLARSETRLTITPSPAAAAPVAAIASNPFEEAATAEATGSIVSAPAAEQKPAATAGNMPAVKVNTVKVVTIRAPEPAPAAQPAPQPKPARPHDGGYGLGPVQDEPQASGAEWLVTKAPVDMHAKAGQTSETVKVADKGLKVRVVARDKNWVQVTDPKTSTTGWIYNRFLTAPEPVEQ